MKELILTVGAPGSGKSTWAQEQVKDKKVKTVVLCRDDLRAMLFGGEYKYSRVNEELVMSAMVHSLTKSLRTKDVKRVIIADTNLNQSTRDKFRDVMHSYNQFVMTEADGAQYKEVPFEAPWPLLVERNNKRGNKAVPKDVLRSMFKNMQIYLGKHKEYKADVSKPKAVIFDLDGTLADNNHRAAFDYDRLIDDKPISHIIELAKLYERDGYEIICVSGRNAGTKADPRAYHKLTAEWLDKHNVPWYALFMREAGDFRKDDIVKEEIFWNKIADHYNVRVAVDDRDQVVEMWRRIGVPCLQCSFGEF